MLCWDSLNIYIHKHFGLHTRYMSVKSYVYIVQSVVYSSWISPWCILRLGGWWGLRVYSLEQHEQHLNWNFINYPATLSNSRRTNLATVDGLTTIFIAYYHIRKKCGWIYIVSAFRSRLFMTTRVTVHKL